MDEFNLIDTYFKTLTPLDTSVLLGVGDDAALVELAPTQALAVAVDTMVSGRHFTTDTNPHAIGYKALAVNLSDLAAMGATPRWFTLSLTLPEADEAWLAEFARGLADCAKQFAVQLIGGDTTRGPLAVSVQLLGEQAPTAVLRRGGANAGDLVYVSGDLGQPAYALNNGTSSSCDKLNYPNPRLALGQALVGCATACIDISDGLAQDLGHILDSSQVGVELELATLPVHAEVLAAMGEEPACRLALSGGDEYELCFTVPEAKAVQVVAIGNEFGVALTRIGRVTAVSGRWLKLADGSQESLAATGYNHF